MMYKKEAQSRELRAESQKKLKHQLIFKPSALCPLPSVLCNVRRGDTCNDSRAFYSPLPSPWEV